MAVAAAYRVQKYPKSVLHEFYQLNGGTPSFEVEPVALPNSTEPRFRCRLTCPAVNNQLGNFQEQMFTAEARAKKGAEHEAASLALVFLRSINMLPPEPPAVMQPPVAAVQAAGGMNMDDIQRSINALAIMYARVEAADPAPPAPLENVSDLERLTDDEISAMSQAELVNRLKEARLIARNLRVRARLEEQRRHQAAMQLTAPTVGNA